VDTLLSSKLSTLRGQWAVREVTVFRDDSHNCEKTTGRLPADVDLDSSRSLQSACDYSHCALCV